MISCDRGVQLEWHQQIMGRVGRRSCRLLLQADPQSCEDEVLVYRKSLKEGIQPLQPKILGVICLLLPSWSLYSFSKRSCNAQVVGRHLPETNMPTRVFKKGDQLCRWKASHIVCINSIIERLNEELKVSGFKRVLPKVLSKVKLSIFYLWM